MPGNPSSPSVMPRGASPTSFVIDVDLAGLLAGLGIDCGTADDQEAVFAAEQEALAASPEPPVEVPGRVAALLPTGAGLAAWLESTSIEQCSDAELPDLAHGYQRLAAWAQGQELSAVAEIASRTAIRRDRAGDAGRPEQVLPEAGAEVALALTMSHLTAMDWTGLATRMRWQLPATGAALTGGRIDLARARIIAEATAPLSDETARAVEQRVLAAAGEQTTGQLRAAVRRAVIAADPDGAERRREHAERCAKVSLYSDQDGTATLVGAGLPVVSAAAAMARITAIARAMKTAGFSGGLDYLRAYVMVGLLLGTLPPGTQPPGTDPPGTQPTPGNPPGKPPADEPPADLPRADEPNSSERPDDAADNNAADDDSAAAADNDAADNDSAAAADNDAADDDSAAAADNDAADDDTAAAADNDAADDDTAAAADNDPAEDDEPINVHGAPVSWPPLPARLSGTTGLPTHVGRPPSRLAPGRPPPGLLDVLLPWSALTAGPHAEPALLGRNGPVTPAQARQLLDLAFRHPATEWRVILTDEQGHAQAVERLRRTSCSPPGRTRARTPTTAPVIGRITVTIPLAALAMPHQHADSKLSVALLRAAERAAARARATHAANHAADSCAHLGATGGYRPPPRLREFVVARDGTCTFPTCGQPAWRTDLDHTLPWHHGGPTCACNLSALCRRHHRTKQLPGWHLAQDQPGHMTWRLPSGRTYQTAGLPYPG